MLSSFYEIFDFLELPNIHILDVGASAIDGNPPYQKLKELNKATIYGFEPNSKEHEILLKQATDNENYFPYALGDGTEAELNICYAPGMTSLLSPNYQILDYFHGFSEWAKIIQQQKLKTYRLDDIAEIDTVDYIKLDVQGSELIIIENGIETISDSLVIHTEVNFIPFYENQPLFAEIDSILRNLGFFLHTFLPFQKRIFKPLSVNNDIYGGINQVLWTDAVYVKKFTEFEQLSSEQLIKIATIMHDVYGSFDLAMLALKYVDQKEEFDFSQFYLQHISNL